MPIVTREISLEIPLPSPYAHTHKISL